MPRKHLLTLCCVPCMMLQGCAFSQQQSQPRAELHVAAASSLTRALPEIDAAFEKQTSIRIVPTYASTGQLTQQMLNGSHFDILLASDTAHVDRLIAAGACQPSSRAVYALGHIVLWVPRRPDFRSVADIVGPSALGIIIADPTSSPYGAAAIEAMRNAGLWDKMQSKNVVYVPDAATAKDALHTDSAFTALSLIVGEPGNYFLIDDSLHQPLDHALCITPQADAHLAATFATFLRSDAGYSILQRYGFGRS